MTPRRSKVDVRVFVCRGLACWQRVLVGVTPARLASVSTQRRQLAHMYFHAANAPVPLLMCGKLPVLLGDYHLYDEPPPHRFPLDFLVAVLHP